MKDNKQRQYQPAPGFPTFWRLIATALGTGYLPVMPGTWGAILAIILWLPLYLWAAPMTTLLVTAIATVVVTVLGTHASTISEQFWGKDPVIANGDEVGGQWLTLIPLSMGVNFCPWLEVLLALALFRFFDIFKPLGIRQMERIPGGWGMMADDLLSGLYGAILLMVVNQFVLGQPSFSF